MALGSLMAAREGANFGGYDGEVVPTPLIALATGLALVPLVVAGSIPGHEIEHPMAVVILGGLATSTLLNLFVVPTPYLEFGRRGSATRCPARWWSLASDPHFLTHVGTRRGLHRQFRGGARRECRLSLTLSGNPALPVMETCAW